MFRHIRKSANRDSFPKQDTSLAGKLFWIKQSELHFGSDAIDRREDRPAMATRDRATEPFVPVMPSTSDAPSSRFYHVPAAKIDFYDQKGRARGCYTNFYLARKSETVSRNYFPLNPREGGIGAIGDTEFNKILQWLRKAGR